MFAVGGMSRWQRRISGVAVAVVAMVLLSPGAGRAEEGVPVPPNDLLSDRGEGDVSAADRDFMVKVRLAGLWEMPAGELAQEKSENRRIRSIGRDIADQHHALDELVVEAARKLDVPLPDEPNEDQQGWLNEMRNAEGAEFDQVYIDRLRAAHGKIFPAIATIRASTRNDTVRKLAQRANQFVMTHMTLLESSGIVNFAALPTAPPPAAAGTGASGTGANGAGVNGPAANGQAAGTQVQPVANVSNPALRISASSMWIIVGVGGAIMALLITIMVVRNLRIGRHRRGAATDSI